MTPAMLRRSLLVVACILTCGPIAAFAEERPNVIVVKTTFENGEQIDPDTGLFVGAPPAQALLMGGTVEIRGVRSAYNTPPHAWVFDEGEAGMIEFETPVHKISFFAAVRANRDSPEPANGSGFATLLDREGHVIRLPVLHVSDEPGVRPDLLPDGLLIPLVNGHPQTIRSVVPIGTILFDHTASGQSFLALDDVSYRVRVKPRWNGDDD